MSFVFRDSSTSSFPICILSFCLISLARTSKTMLNKRGDCGHAPLFPS
jgi:hypothetical protein